MPERSIEVTMLTHRMENEPVVLPQVGAEIRLTMLQPQQWVDAHPDDGAYACRTAIYAREHLTVADEINGPAILTQLDATTIIPTGWRAVVAPTLDIIMTRHDPS
jgi:N-methylhydantoinase A/oxoprolinase/acetone carboxylase beta subunit